MLSYHTAEFFSRPGMQHTTTTGFQTTCGVDNFILFGEYLEEYNTMPT